MYSNPVNANMSNVGMLGLFKSNGLVIMRPYYVVGIKVK